MHNANKDFLLTGLIFVGAKLPQESLQFWNISKQCFLADAADRAEGRISYLLITFQIYQRYLCNLREQFSIQLG